MSTITDQSIAALLASGRIEGDVQVTGMVTRAKLHTTAAGHRWAVITLDDGTAQIAAQVSPRTWRDSTCPVRLGKQLTVHGRLDDTPDGLTILANSVTTADPT